jgi:hypothetical protein
MSMYKPLSTKTVLFSPFALAWQHTFPSLIIVRAIRELGGDVSIVTCGSRLNASCAIYRARGLDSSRDPRGAARTCTQCKRVSARSTERGVDTYQLDSFVSETDLEKLTAYCDAITPGAVSETPWHKQPIARFAIFLHMTSLRAETATISAEHLDAFRRETYSVGIALVAGERYALENDPETVIVSDLLYGINRAFIAGVKNICPNARAIGLYSSPNLAKPYRRLQWVEDVGSTPFCAAKTAWPMLTSQMAAKTGIDGVGDYLKTSITGRRFRSFSGSVEPDALSLRRDVLGLDSTKIITLVALSSEDEMLAASESRGVSYRPQPYSSQLDWLEDISRVAEETPDVHFVIRPHPRFWANPANPQRRSLEDRRQSFHPRMTLLPPERFASLYALLNEADVVLTSWSTVGLEARALGIPALAYGTDLQGAPDSILPAPATRDQYLEELQVTLTSRRWSLETAIEMFRWLDFAWHRSNLDLGSVLPERFDHQTRASSDTKRDYADLIAYRFLPATMARMDMRQAKDRTSIRASVQEILEHGIVAYAATQSAPNQTTAAEEAAIRAALEQIALLLPEIKDEAPNTLRGRLLALS